MKAFTALAALAIATPAAAGPVDVGPSMVQSNYNTYATSVGSYLNQPVRDTPAMAQRRLDRAIALREEARALVASDGGTLTPRHRRYLQRKADAI